MTDRISALHRLARKIIPLRARRSFVRHWDARRRGTHHTRPQQPPVDRREALMDLARNWSGYGPTVRMYRLHDLADPSLKGRDLDTAWDTFLGEVALLDGINGEPWAVECDWSDVDPELTCPDRTEAARDEMEMRVAGARDLLIRGTR